MSTREKGNKIEREGGKEKGLGIFVRPRREREG